MEKQYIGARYVPILGGTWNNLNSYEALTIVQANNNSYTSKKPVPPGIDITNTEYWVVTGNFNGQVEEYRQEALKAIETANSAAEKVSNAESMASAAQTAATNAQETADKALEKIENVDFTFIGGHIDIYVAGTSGSDDNDGNSNSPVKTLDKAVDIMNKKGSGAYIYLTESGNYEINSEIFYSVAVHLVYSAADITVYWMPAGSSATKCFYGGYVDIVGQEDGNSRFYIRGNKNAYVEGGAFTASQVIFDGDNGIRFGFISCGALLSYCEFKTKVYCGRCNISFEYCKFSPKAGDISGPAIQTYNSSNITFANAEFVVPASSDELPNFVSCSASVLFVRSVMTVTGGSLDHPLALDSATILGSTSRVNSWMHSNGEATVKYSIVNGTFRES